MEGKIPSRGLIRPQARAPDSKTFTTWCHLIQSLYCVTMVIVAGMKTVNSFLLSTSRTVVIVLLKNTYRLQVSVIAGLAFKL